ncbi:hypothetical protein [Arthrobacter sp. MYb213]|uniref:hypothetical protein n=1 Tax=Arthrobacter sp. MYb213 TaxID=1848595 RepID=UPI000CFD033A|nr:hypothetical protein [Arthrobacter sp. MYb213]PRB70371.1 hypothetical protein CQ011_09470 [Arthrobacter sp. MYb213]
MAKRVVDERGDGKWGLRIVADNAIIIAMDRTQSYENEHDARSMTYKILGGEYADAEKSRREWSAK